MMQTSQYPTQAGIGPGHPSMAHGHPGMQMQHGHMGQPNPAMMAGMHHGMTNPQVTQGPMVSNMPPNASTPAPGGQMGNAMAMAHLSAQGPMFQGQHPGMNMGQMLQQQNNMAGQMGANMIARQRAMQAQMNGHMGGQVMGMQNPMNISAAQLQQMKMGMPMQHMQHMSPQQQQQQQQQLLQQQQRMHQQQSIMQQQQLHNQALLQQQRVAAAAQQHAVQQQQQQQVVQAQQMQMSRSQGDNVVTQPPPTVSTPAPQPQPPPQPQAQPVSTPQHKQQTPQQKPQQPPPPTTQAPPQNPPTPQIKQGDSDEEARPDVKNQILMEEEMRANANQDFSGQCILQLMLYYDHLAAPARPLDVNYWQDVMQKYYSPFATLRQQIVNTKLGHDKQYQLRYPSLARFYHSHFQHGVKKIHMQSYEHSQNALPNGGYHVWSKKLFVTHEYENGIKVISYGNLNVNFDDLQKIESLYISLKGWDEVIPRSLLESPILSPEQNRQSPKQSKKNLPKQQQTQRPLPKSPIGVYGIPQGLQQFLEIAEVITAMDPLIQYYCDNDISTASEALMKYNMDKANPMSRNMQQQNANAAAANGQLQFPSQRMGMNPPNNFQSPALAHLNLPNQQSPHMNHTPSPGHPGHGGVQMVHQMSAQGSIGSQGATSNNTSPATNKRRRPSAIKEEDAQAAAGESNKTKPSPRVGKRQKGAAA